MVELGQQPRLVDEAAHAELEGLAVPLRQRRDRAVELARGERGRQVFLDRDHAFERRVPGLVDDAEAALPDDARDLEFGEPAAHRQQAGLGIARRLSRRA